MTAALSPGQFTLTVVSGIVCRYPDPYLTDTHVQTAMAPTLPPNPHSIPVLTGMVAELERFARTEQTGWLIDLAHDI